MGGTSPGGDNLIALPLNPILVANFHPGVTLDGVTIRVEPTSRSSGYFTTGWLPTFTLHVENASGAHWQGRVILVWRRESAEWMSVLDATLPAGQSGNWTIERQWVGGVGMVECHLPLDVGPRMLGGLPIDHARASASSSRYEIICSFEVREASAVAREIEQRRIERMRFVVLAIASVLAAVAASATVILIAFHY